MHVEIVIMTHSYKSDCVTVHKQKIETELVMYVEIIATSAYLRII